ncbi:hypothetical protein L1049_024333 [Liquidambar formosana]|uniref:Large ribosomal subunit protein bL25 beta domain-containing protein n=1 Tax=Liquidambar formosana TaxID=63359 RepID=A0AAP0RVM7_LIQFO
MVQWWRTAAGRLGTVVLNPRCSPSSTPTAAYHTIQAYSQGVERKQSLRQGQGPRQNPRRRIHRDPETGKIMNLVFVWADEGSELKVDVPVVFKGEDVCPGLQKGGHLNKIRSTLKYLCPTEHIPPKIEVDVSNLDIEDRIFMRDIDVHPSLKLLSKNENMPICKIVATNWGSSEPAAV